MPLEKTMLWLRKRRLFDDPLPVWKIGDHRKLFVVSVSVLLLLTAAAKVIALLQGKPFLNLPDPVLNVKTSYALGIAAGLEIIVAIVVLLRRKSPLALISISWLVGAFVFYRILRWASFVTAPCSCLGSVLDWTGLPSKILNAIPEYLLWYMGIGSVLLLAESAFPYRSWFSRSKLLPSRIAAYCLWVIFLFPNVASARDTQGVRLEGMFVRLTYNGKGKQVVDRCLTNTFRASLLADGRYDMAVEAVGQSNSVYLTFDGKDSYALQFPKQVISVRQPDKSKGRPPIGVAHVFAGSFPYGSFDDWFKRLQMLWLVYGSGNYIHNLGTNEMPMPWLDARIQLDAYGFRLEHEDLSGPLFLPRHARFIRDSRVDMSDDQEVARPELAYANDATLPQFISDIKQRKRDYKDGFLRGELTVSNVTNFNGMELPMSFSIKGYSHSMPGPFWEAFGYVTNLTVLSSAEVSLPPTPLPTQVNDERFRSEPQKLSEVIYGILPGEKWLAKDSPTLKRLYSETLRISRVQQIRHPAQVHNQRVSIGWVVFIILLGLPALLFWKIRTNKVKQALSSDVS